MQAWTGREMRLLDEITQHAAPLWVVDATPGSNGGLRRLPCAADFAESLRTCPLRYVLDDGMTAACVELAVSEGDRLSGCLDLVRLPAQRFWVEWNDAVREHLVRSVSNCVSDGEPTSGRAGAYVESSADGRRGVLHSFWMSDGEPVCLAPLQTHLDLSCAWRVPAPVGDALQGGFVELNSPGDPHMEQLLDCMRFRYQEPWADYYREARPSPQQADLLLRSCLATVARDMPIVLAFSLLISARNAVEQRLVDRRNLNRRRVAKHKRALLDHIEVHCAIDTDEPGASPVKGGGAMRQHPRLHHVRGHLVRRANDVFWRRTHIRGRARAGTVLSRTVHLSFAGSRVTR